jgi:hypothetical protein
MYKSLWVEVEIIYFKTGNPACVLFIDYEKVYDRMPRGQHWNTVTNNGCPNHIVKTVQSWYFNTRMKIDKGTSVGNKEIHQGVMQGCPMSPSLFLNLFEVSKKCKLMVKQVVIMFNIGRTQVYSILRTSG